MKSTRPLPPYDYLNRTFTYDPFTGQLFWKERPRHFFATKKHWHITNARQAGKEAGSKSFQRDGRPSGIRVGLVFNGRHSYYYAHRIIYSIMGVEIPMGYQVDHRDGNPFNNQWSNLRIATDSQNQANRRKNKIQTLPKGVRFVRDGKYRVVIACKGKKHHIGYFSTPKEAHAAYCAKASELHGEFARFN